MTGEFVPDVDSLVSISPDFHDPVIEAFKKDVDRSLLRENLNLTPEQRSRKFERNMRLVYELRRSRKRMR